MLALMAAVTKRFTRHRWNHTYREEIIRKALDFPLDHVVERYRQQEQVAEDFARDLERELRRYLILCALYPTFPFPMYGPVDKLWHVFITFTHDYAAFCRQVAGRFIHHMPEPMVSPVYRDPRDTLYFVELYAYTFGEPPPDHIWPLAKIEETRRRRPNILGGIAGGCYGIAEVHSASDNHDGGYSGDGSNCSGASGCSGTGASGCGGGGCGGGGS